MCLFINPRNRAEKLRNYVGWLCVSNICAAFFAPRIFLYYFFVWSNKHLGSQPLILDLPICEWIFFCLPSFNSANIAFVRFISWVRPKFQQQDPIFFNKKRVSHFSVDFASPSSPHSCHKGNIFTILLH